jgi:hypothetical protein
MRRHLLLFAVCLPLGCALDSEGKGEPNSGGSGGSGADVATVGGSGGTSPVDASWPGDAAGTGATQPGDAAIDSTLDVGKEATPEAGVESDCFNGLDDDGDGLTDCEDPDCAALVRCVPEAPAGWNGLLFVRTRGDQEPVTDCGSMITGDTYRAGLVAGPHTCACSCGSPTGGSCGTPAATIYPMADCSGIAGASLVGAGCFPLMVSGVDAPKSVRATVATVVWPTCPVSAIPNPLEVSWKQAVDTCQVKQSATCEAKEVCVPLPLPGMEPVACILRAGDHVCPAPFTDKRVYYAGFDDGRKCSAAGCVCSVVGIKCGGKVRAQANTECTNAVGAFDIDGACHAITTPTPVVAVSLTPDASPSGSCKAVGTAVPTGSATPTGAHTVCCSSL